MKSLVLALFVFVCLTFNASADTENDDGYYVGYRKMTVTSEKTDEKFPLALLYPTDTPSENVQFGPFQMDLSVGATVASGDFPLVIISHGSGGTNLGYRSIAFALVKQGYVVGIPLHPKNNFQNNAAEGTNQNWKTDHFISVPRLTRFCQNLTFPPTSTPIKLPLSDTRQAAIRH